MLAVIGTAIGLVVAYLSGRIVASRIYAIRASDPAHARRSDRAGRADHGACDDDPRLARLAPEAVRRAARRLTAARATGARIRVPPRPLDRQQVHT